MEVIYIYIYVSIDCQVGIQPRLYVAIVLDAAEPYMCNCQQ